MPVDTSPLIDAQIDAPVDVGPDAAPTFTLTGIFPAATSRTVTTALTISGAGINGTPTIRLTNCDQASTTYDVTAGTVTATSITTSLPVDPTRMQGAYTVTVTNGDGMVASLMCALKIVAEPPPTVTLVVPTAAWQGVTTDAINSDATVSIQGMGFCSTPNPAVHFDADFVGYVSPTQLSTVVPAESQMMTAGTYNIFVTNPDNLSAEWLSGTTPGVFTITPSSDGHLNSGSWEGMSNSLETARWKHATPYGFDSFGNAFMYVAGGQDGAGTVLGSVEASHFDVFGTPGPFASVQQYGTPTAPRVANTLTVPRAGSTLVRVGKSLFSIGGTTSRSETTTIVAASKVVERAQILCYKEMPAMRQPTASGTGLPVGSWYYRISAIGPWGESLATREVVAINKSGQVQVCWVSPTATGVASYNIYHSLASDGRAGSSAALA